MKMELFLMICKVSILKEFSVQSVLRDLWVKQSSFGLFLSFICEDLLIEFIV